MAEATLGTEAGCHQYCGWGSSAKGPGHPGACCHLLAVCKTQLLKERRMVCSSVRRGLLASPGWAGGVHQVNAASGLAPVLSLWHSTEGSGRNKASRHLLAAQEAKLLKEPQAASGLGGAGSRGVTRVEPVEFTRLVQVQFRRRGGGLDTGKMAFVRRLHGRRAHHRVPGATHFRLFLCISGAARDAVPLPEPRVSAWD